MDPAQAAAAQTAAEQQAAAEHAAAEVVAAQQSAAREAAGKAAAEAANLAWRTNTGPVLPAYADQQPTFTAYDTLGKPYQVSAAQDAANEAAKYAQFNSPIDYGRYANVPLVQMPAGLAGPVQPLIEAGGGVPGQGLLEQRQLPAVAPGRQEPLAGAPVPRRSARSASAAASARRPPPRKQLGESP